MVKWNFISGSKEDIIALHNSFNSNNKLVDFYTSKTFLVDKNGDLRGRADDKENKLRETTGYNMNSVADLNKIMKDDILVLYYEYYASFKDKNENKADRKEMGL
jgi:hypothetical protein